jgi:RNA polymerase sigma-70 factor (ECF subfamily)
MFKISEEEFNEIYYKYYKLLYHIAYTYVNNDTAADIVQDVFIKYLNETKHFDNEDNLMHWLVRVCINKSIDVLRHKKVVKKTLQYMSEQSRIDNNNSINQDIYERVCMLDNKYKEVIILYYYENLKIDDISKILKISPSAVKMRLARAKEKLRITKE